MNWKGYGSKWPLPSRVLLLYLPGRDWGRQWRTPVTITAVSVETRTENLLNESLFLQGPTVIVEELVKGEYLVIFPSLSLLYCATGTSVVAYHQKVDTYNSGMCTSVGDPKILHTDFTSVTFPTQGMTHLGSYFKIFPSAPTSTHQYFRLTEQAFFFKVKVKLSL
jgi:hypothetical protein